MEEKICRVEVWGGLSSAAHRSCVPFSVSSLLGVKLWWVIRREYGVGVRTRRGRAGSEVLRAPRAGMGMSVGWLAGWLTGREEDHDRVTTDCIVFRFSVRYLLCRSILPPPSPPLSHSQGKGPRVNHCPALRRESESRRTWFVVERLG